MTGAALESPSTGVSTIDRDAVALSSQRKFTLLRPIADPAEIIAVQNETRNFVHQALVEGRDYGVIPGTGSRDGKEKKTLLKPGAERTALGFGCYYGEPIIVESEVDHNRDVPWRKIKKIHEWNGNKRGKWLRDEVTEGASLGLYRYVVKVALIEGMSGRTIATGIGVCSTMESKYIDRPRDSENTALKMAHKRAVVAACLLGFGLSDEFTQDMEDLERPVEDEHGNATQRPAGAAVKTSDARAQKPATEKLFPFKGEWKDKPIGSMPMSAIEGFCKWIREKQTEKNNKSWNGDLLDALVEVLAAKQDEAEKDQGKLELEPKATANPQPAAGDAASSASLVAAAGSSAAEKPRELPANRARWNTAQLQARALELIKHPKLPTSMLDAAMVAQLNEGKLNHAELVKQVTTLEKWLDDAEAFDENNDANDDDDLPF